MSLMSFALNWIRNSSDHSGGFGFQSWHQPLNMASTVYEGKLAKPTAASLTFRDQSISIGAGEGGGGRGEGGHRVFSLSSRVGHAILSPGSWWAVIFKALDIALSGKGHWKKQKPKVTR